MSAQPDLVAGGLFITTRSTMQSKPRAATSVATNTLNFFSRKAFIVFSRSACGMSPCRALLSKGNILRFDDVVALGLRFAEHYRTTGTIRPHHVVDDLVILTPRRHGTHVCFTSVEACTILFNPSFPPPTRSISANDV